MGSTTYSYAYDFCGNITSANGHTYTYGNTQWKDLLTAYDGQAISYDGSGNPTSYYNGTRWTFGWEEGRNLVSASSNNKTISYAYDHEGVRTSKTVGSEKHNYIYASGKLLRETFGTTVIDFFYDANGRPYAMTQGGATYYYVLNLQGDVMGVMDGSGNLVAKYKYDPYGNILSTTGSKADIYNPLRYRGYYYDTETGLYYLQSRYYDPAIGRFINADDASLLGADGSLLGYNLFAYSQNNPVNLSDDGGNIPSWATKLIVGTAVIAAAAALTVVTAGTGTALACFAVGALKGAAVGAAMGAATGAASGAVSHRISTGSWEGVGEAALNGAADGYMNGAISGFVAGGLTSNACFVAGTAVLAASGSIPIENIKAGDYVWAWDEQTGDVALKQVVETYVNESGELIHVFVNGEEIVTTPSHPFYSPEKGWTKAVHLRAGDILVLVNGEYVVVEKVQHEILEAPVTVYNFQVEDYHTYYVSDGGILVHNTCRGNAVKKLGKMSRTLLEQLAKELETGHRHK